MMYQLRQQRFISFKSITSFFSRKSNTKNELTKPIKQLPKTTGVGAFVEPTSFEILGNNFNLLNIKLPKSSILNLRYDNGFSKIIAVNGGPISNLHIELGKIGKSTIFQRCFNSNEPMSILLSLNSSNSNFVALDSKQKDDLSWLVKKESLLAWSGNYLDLNESENFDKLVSIKGDGRFVLSSPGSIVQINLKEGEIISVNPLSVIAYSALESSAPTPEVKYFADLSIPKVSMTSRLSYYTSKFNNYLSSQLKKNNISIPENKELTKVTSAIGSFFSAVFNTIRVGVGRVMSGSSTNYMVEFKGPKTLLIHNNLRLKSELMSNDEIQNLT